MKFKVDENLPVELAELLHQAVHDGTTVPDEHLRGRSDSDIAAICKIAQIGGGMLND